MERVVQLLLVCTVVSLFAYLLIFYALGNTANGGEYWGFRATVRGSDAALQSFERGDFRFLSVKMRDQAGRDVWYVPAIVGCADNPYGERAYSRQSHGTGLHGDNSFALADNFAREYNLVLAGQLRDKRNVVCESLLDK